MSILITQTKIILPRRRADLLSRQRLLDLVFDLMDYKLIIMVAPAGYGKTSLLIDFAYHSDLAVCWYSLDSLDQDPARFIAHFIASIRVRFPGFGQKSFAALESNLQTTLDIDNLVATIVNEAYEFIREHFILAIDDYHLVNDQKEISYFISRFAQEVDDNCHLILSSRSLLTLPDMPLLVARSMVGGLSFEELAFLPDEIQSLLGQNYNIFLSRAAVEELSLATEGWITGLLLSRQTIQQGFTDRLRIARVTRVDLYDYLAQQVLDQQPADVRDFLLETSLLEEFDLSLCQSVLDDDRDYRSLFDYVLENNLFVLPVGEDGRWIRYHHLFKDFLQTRLEEEKPQEKTKILKRLVNFYTDSGEWDKAYSISKQLKELKVTINLIIQAGPSMILNGRLNLLAEWIDDLPSNEVNNNPHLMSLRAVPEIIIGQSERGLALINSAIKGLRELDDSPELARALSRRANILRFSGKYKESLEDALEAQRLIIDKPDLQSYQADASRAAGISYYQTGRVDEALNELNLALNIYQKLGERQNAAATLMDIGLVFMGTGQYQQSLYHYEQALNYWREVNNTVRLANLLNNLGVLNHLIGNYEQAAATFEEALMQARQIKYARMEAYILASIGDLYSDLDANKAALDAYAKSHDIANTIGYHFLLFYTDLATAARFRSLGNIDQAQKYLGYAKHLLIDNSSDYERGLFELEAGRIMQAKGNLLVAINWLEDAVHHFETAGQPVENARGRLLLADALYQAGKTHRALEELNAAITKNASLDSQHVLVVSGMHTKTFLETAHRSPYLSNQAGDLLLKVEAYEATIPSLRKRLRSHAPNIPLAPPKLVIRAFGKAQVERDGKPVSAPEWQNQKKVRELFFYLLTKPKGASKDEIGLTFWSESSASQLKLQFKNAIYRLRHALGPEIVLFDEDVYWFNRDLDYEYDVEKFQSLINSARSDHQDESRIKTYGAALTIYKGPFLAEAEGSWVWKEREQLREMYIQTALELTEIHYKAKDFTSALEYCQYALDEEPSLEEAHRLAMQIYAARGNRAGVSRQFERCKMILKSEVNASPSPQTVSLYEELLR